MPDATWTSQCQASPPLFLPASPHVLLLPALLGPASVKQLITNQYQHSCNCCPDATWTSQCQAVDDCRCCHGPQLLLLPVATWTGQYRQAVDRRRSCYQHCRSYYCCPTLLGPANAKQLMTAVVVTDQYHHSCNCCPTPLEPATIKQSMTAVVATSINPATTATPPETSWTCCHRPVSPQLLLLPDATWISQCQAVDDCGCCHRPVSPQLLLLPDATWISRCQAVDRRRSCYQQCRSYYCWPTPLEPASVKQLMSHQHQRSNRPFLDQPGAKQSMTAVVVTDQYHHSYYCCFPSPLLPVCADKQSIAAVVAIGIAAATTAAHRRHLNQPVTTAAVTNNTTTAFHRHLHYHNLSYSSSLGPTIDKSPLLQPTVLPWLFIIASEGCAE